MPVVISEFQVISDDPAPAPAAEQAPDPAANQATRAPSPHDIHRVLRREHERRARVRAH